MLGGARRVVVPVAAVLTLALAPAGPAWAGPAPGERYDGTSATGQRIFVEPSRDGSRLARYDMVVTTRCNDSKRRTQGLYQANEPPVRIAADGTFSNTPDWGRNTYPTRRGPVTGRAHLAFSGTFSADANSVAGTITARFRSARFRCSSGPVTYTIHRDGTAGAPWRDGLMATGLYTAKGRGQTSATFRTLAPARRVRKAIVNWRSPCRSGGHLTGAVILTNFQVIRSRIRSVARDGRRLSDGGGLSSFDSWRLRFRFFARDGRYFVEGSLRISSVVRRNGRPIDRCSATRRFSGAFRQGPE